jgi:hypothetical protein
MTKCLENNSEEYIFLQKHKSLNEKTFRLLEYYCGLEKAPEYAVLLTGVWGSGKTWFATNFLEKYFSDKKKYIYVSLHGVQSFQNIEDEFFRQLHPFISSKPARLGINVIKGLLKTSIKLDLDGQHKADASISIGNPTDKLFDKSKVPDGVVLVFDDLERCSIPIADLLGYINHFVENRKLKVVILANEQEIDNKNPSYRLIKEKLIGKTFEVYPDFNAAFNYFLNEFSSHDFENLIIKNKPSILKIYYDSQSKNLRLLRHALWDLDRIYNELPEKIKKNEVLLSEFIAWFLVYFFEFRSGALMPNELKHIRSSYFDAFANKKDDESNNKYKKIRDKYVTVNFIDTPLITDEIWEEIFVSGSVPIIELVESLLNSKYFQEENQEPWIKLWYGYDLSDQEFDKIIKMVLHQWSNHYFTKVGEILHVVGLLLRYSKAGLFNKTEDEIINDAKNYIKWMKTVGILPAKGLHDIHDSDAFRGLGFASYELQSFRDFRAYLYEQQRVVLSESYPSEAGKLLNLMKSNTEEFVTALILSNDRNNRFYDQPILAHLSPVEFVDSLVKISPVQRQKVFSIFKERYSAPFIERLIPELSWLQNVESLVRVESEKLSGKMSGYTLALGCSHYIKPAISALENYKNLQVSDKNT